MSHTAPAVAVTVYSKPTCVQCDATYRALDKNGIDYTVLIPEESWARVDGIIPLIIAPFQTLLGAAIGWYFSERLKG